MIKIFILIREAVFRYKLKLNIILNTNIINLNKKRIIYVKHKIQKKLSEKLWEEYIVQTKQV